MDFVAGENVPHKHTAAEYEAMAAATAEEHRIAYTAAYPPESAERRLERQGAAAKYENDRNGRAHPGLY